MTSGAPSAGAGADHGVLGVIQRDSPPRAAHRAPARPGTPPGRRRPAAPKYARRRCSDGRARERPVAASGAAQRRLRSPPGRQPTAGLTAPRATRCAARENASARFSACWACGLGRLAAREVARARRRGCRLQRRHRLAEPARRTRRRGRARRRAGRRAEGARRRPRSSRDERVRLGRRGPGRRPSRRRSWSGRSTARGCGRARLVRGRVAVGGALAELDGVVARRARRRGGCGDRSASRLGSAARDRARRSARDRAGRRGCHGDRVAKIMPGDGARIGIGAPPAPGAVTTPFASCGCPGGDRLWRTRARRGAGSCDDANPPAPAAPRRGCRPAVGTAGTRATRATSLQRAEGRLAAGLARGSTRRASVVRRVVDSPQLLGRQPRRSVSDGHVCRCSPRRPCSRARGNSVLADGRLAPQRRVGARPRARRLLSSVLGPPLTSCSVVAATTSSSVGRRRAPSARRRAHVQRGRGSGPVGAGAAGFGRVVGARPAARTGTGADTLETC